MKTFLHRLGSVLSLYQNDFVKDQTLLDLPFHKTFFRKDIVLLETHILRWNASFRCVSNFPNVVDVIKSKSCVSAWSQRFQTCQWILFFTWLFNNWIHIFSFLGLIATVIWIKSGTSCSQICLLLIAYLYIKISFLTMKLLLTRIVNDVHSSSYNPTKARQGFSFFFHHAKIQILMHNIYDFT